MKLKKQKQPSKAMYETRNTGTRNGMRGTQGMGVMLYSGECPQTFRGMSPNIPGNVLKHSGEYRQTFRGMSSKIPGNVAKDSGECCQPKVPGNVAEHSGEYPIYFDGRELVEALSITVVFSGELLIVCSVIFCVENLAKLLAARLNSGENLISMP